MELRTKMRVIKSSGMSSTMNFKDFLEQYNKMKEKVQKEIKKQGLENEIDVEFEMEYKDGYASPPETLE